MQNEMEAGGPAAVDHHSASSSGDWRNLVTGIVGGFAVDTVRPGKFRGELRRFTHEGVDFIHIATGSHLARRDEAQAAAESRSDLFLNLQLEGTCRMTQNGRTEDLKAGDFMLCDAARPGEVLAEANHRSLSLRFPRELLGIPHGYLEQVTAVRIQADTGLAPAVGAFLLNLHRTIPDIGLRGRRAAVRHLLGLAGAMVQTQLEATGIRPQLDPQQALLERIDGYIEKHLSDPALDASSIAAAHFISYRRLHALYEGTGNTVAASIRARRLERCRQDLADPFLATIPVAAIAGRWGFSSASHFSQVFRVATGQTPAEYRQLQLGTRMSA